MAIWLDPAIPASRPRRKWPATSSRLILARAGVSGSEGNGPVWHVAELVLGVVSG